MQCLLIWRKPTVYASVVLVSTFFIVIVSVVKKSCEDSLFLVLVPRKF